MRVRYLVSFAGEGFVIEVGAELDLQDAGLAHRLIERGYAELIREGPEVETAAIEPGDGKRKRKAKVE